LPILVAEWKYPHAPHFRNVIGGESVFATTVRLSLPHFGHGGVFVIFPGMPRELQERFPVGGTGESDFTR
jgi:hypothetical protein